MSLSFPASPVTGQTFQNWYWTGAQWDPLPGPSGVLTSRRVVFTANGTYFPSPGLVFADLEALGGGGGGGGVTAASGQGNFGAGGGAGAYAKRRATPTQIGSSQTVTIGAAGAAGTATTNGGAGGATSIGSLVTAPGGGGGNASTSTISPSPGLGGAAGTGDLTQPGANGGGGINGPGNEPVTSGNGGDSLYGSGGIGIWTTGVSQAGNAARGYGAGGGGAASWSTGSAAGGAGAPGLAVVTEYLWSSGPMQAGAIASGNRVLITQQVVSTPVASVDFVSGISSSYDQYEFDFYNVLTSTNDYFMARCSSDGGTTWPATTADYSFGASSAYGSYTNAGWSGANAFASLQLTSGAQTVNTPIFGRLRLFTPANATLYKTVMWDAGYYSSNYGVGNFRGAGTYNHATAVNGFRFLNNTGNITAGTFKLYGVAN